MCLSVNDIFQSVMNLFRGGLHESHHRIMLLNGFVQRILIAGNKWHEHRFMRECWKLITETHHIFTGFLFRKKRKLRNQMNLKWMDSNTVKLSIKFIHTILWHNYSLKNKICVPFCVISSAYLSRIEFLDRRECLRWKVTRNKKLSQMLSPAVHQFDCALFAISFAPTNCNAMRPN